MKLLLAYLINNNNNNNNNLYLYRITWSAYLEAAISQGPVKIKR